MSLVVPREYQVFALEAIVRRYRERVQRQLLQMAVGLGKTTIFCLLEKYLDLGRWDVVLTVAHTDELIDQAVDAFQRIVPGSWVERERNVEHASPMAKIIVGSVQTLKGARLKEFFRRQRPGKIRVLVIDEAHHSTSPTYQNLVQAFFEYNPEGLLLGVTATARRRDRVGLDNVYDEIVFDMDMRAGMGEGYLCPIEAYQVESSTSIADVHTRGGDFAIDELARAVDNKERNSKLVRAYEQRAPGKQAIFFAVNVAHAKHLAALLTARGFPSVAVYGDMPKEERPIIIERFRQGDLTVLVSVSVLLEGFNVPGVEVIGWARPTTSTTVAVQGTGRGLRPHDSIAHLLGPGTTSEERRALIAASPKPTALILDVVDVTTKTTLVTVPSLVGLPPRFKLQGRRLMEVLQAFEQAREKNAEAAAAAQSVEDLDVILTSVDPFKVQVSDGEGSELTWFEVGTEAWKLRIPSFTLAFKDDGKRIERYDARLRFTKLRLRGQGIYDPVEQAEQARRLIGVARERRINAALEIRLAAGKYAVLREVNGGWIQLFEDEERVTAFMWAEEYVREKFPEATAPLKRKAQWRDERRKRGQMRRLRELGVDEKKMPKTRGECSEMIEAIEMRNELAREVGGVA